MLLRGNELPHLHISKSSNSQILFGMQTQANIDYNRIAETIAFVRKNFKSQPSVDEMAERVHVRPLHFKRMFTEWAGTSPQKFLQYISLEHTKKILEADRATLFETAFETELSSRSRLHDLFVNIERMPPGEYKNGGSGLHIHYSFADSPFGSLLLASTPKGICRLEFEDHRGKALGDLKAKFPNAKLEQKPDELQENALSIFRKDWSNLHEVKLHLKGTDFQLNVWESLLKIPFGRLSSYGSIAERIGRPKAARAVGTAIGSNPIAFLIPCHRVVRTSGKFDGYRWGTTRKAAIIGWEQARVNGGDDLEMPV